VIVASILRRGLGLISESDKATKPATFTFSDMASQGEAYVKTVRSEAVKEVQKATSEAAAIRQKAEAEGRAAAEATLAKLLDDRLSAKLKTLQPALEAVVAELTAARGEWLAHWRSEAVRLSVAIAERILRRELAADPTISQHWLTEALDLAAGASDITVRLAPTDLDHLKRHAESLAATMAGIGEARFVPDPSIEPGGCRVETRHGAIDQQHTSQHDRLAEELGYAANS
jgi:flagellar assembly protein FliH